jgi:hypothetical protein
MSQAIERSTPIPSRRAVLAGIAAAPALAAPALALSGAGPADAELLELSRRFGRSDDPVLDAIAMHAAAWATLNSKCSALDSAHTPEAEAELERLFDEEQDATGELADVMPATLFGAISLLRHAAEMEGRDGGTGYYFKDDDGKTKPFSFFIHRNVAAALEETRAIYLATTSMPRADSEAGS